MMGQTHVRIDGQLHRIARVEEAPTGPAHTHRVFLGCGMTVDVDQNGKRHTEAADRLRDMAAKPGADPGHAKLHLARADQYDAEAVQHAANKSRWCTVPKADCTVCAKFEAGADPVTIIGHTPHRVTLGDIKTGLPCPTCGSDLYIRRRDKTVTCTAQGHDFEVPEVIATSMGLLHRLATGKLEE